MVAQIPSDEEIKDSIWNIHPLKSPGLDGFHSIFYQKYWDSVKDRLINFVKKCFKCGRIQGAVNKTFLVLIPKRDKACIFNHFGPISLYNFAYKVVAKILASRLNGVLGKLISPNQGAFVRGRWIMNNTVIAQEVVHHIKKHKGKNVLMVMKIDMKKAYDKMKWTFLVQVLRAWEFNDHFQQMIYRCINIVFFSLLLNCNITKTFSPSCGLRKGDTFSPLDRS